jgi:biopolymer transport protein TolQ
MTMTLIATLAASVAEGVGAPGHLNPVKLFLDADIVVKVVMVGLILASIWVWMIIFSFMLRIGGVRRRSAAYEKDFWETADFDRLQTKYAGQDVPLARVAAAGFGEWQLSTAAENVDHEGLRQRMSLTLDSEVAQEADRLAERLNFLATVGSVAPFVGLFGTVWGIMNSFFQIGQQQNSSLAVVAPGISEALFATAIGLFAAIPAVIAYNRLSHGVNMFEARMQRFADRFMASLSRQLEQ